MKMYGVLSAFIDAIGWEDGVLEVWLKSGVGYRYPNVSEKRFNMLFEDSDFGKNFNEFKKDYALLGYLPEKFQLPLHR